MTAAFDGATYDAALDYERLSRQQAAVARVMADGRWHTLADLAAMSGASEASVSARLRDLRKPKCGALNIARRRDPDSPGVWWYRLDGTMPANAVAPSRPSRADLERRLQIITEACDEAAQVQAPYLRADVIRQIATGEVSG